MIRPATRRNHSVHKLQSISAVKDVHLPALRALQALAWIVSFRGADHFQFGGLRASDAAKHGMAPCLTEVAHGPA